MMIPLSIDYNTVSFIQYFLLIFQNMTQQLINSDASANERIYKLCNSIHNFDILPHCCCLAFCWICYKVANADFSCGFYPTSPRPSLSRRGVFDTTNTYICCQICLPVAFLSMVYSCALPFQLTSLTSLMFLPSPGADLTVIALLAFLSNCSSTARQSSDLFSIFCFFSQVF